jgi:UDP-N-acetylglucosamine:LPS N-acetylglucosamine transferase
MIVDLIYMDAGGGHRSSAQALQAAITEQQPGWTVRLLNIFSILDPQDQFRRLTGMGPEDFYNKRLAKGWTLGMAQELKLLQLSISLLHRKLTARLAPHWLSTRPSLVVSLIPNFNRALYESLRESLPHVPYVTILTDLADHPPNFWIEPDQDQYFICGTRRACEQASAAGYSQDRIFRSSGMILHPKFYRPSLPDRAAEQARHHLDPGRPTGVVIFGGQGSSKMLHIARYLDDTQLILICGRNAALAAKLRTLKAQAPRLVVGFTNEVSYYMALSDFFIGKPGPGSISEAVAMRLPVIIEGNAWTMPQEVYNTRWVVEQNVGVVIKRLREIEAAVARVTHHLPFYRQSLAQVENRAVFEIPRQLEEIRARCAADRAAEMPPHAHPDIRTAWTGAAAQPTIETAAT